MTARRVVVTGLGATTPLGGDATSTWSALLAGKSGVRLLTEDWREALPVHFAARVAVEPADQMERVEMRRLDRSEQFALIASREAWKDAGSPDDIPKDRLGVVIASGIGGVIQNPSILIQVVFVFFLFIANFAILFGPLMLMGITQIKAFEPGDADWGVKLEDVRGQAEPKEEVRRVVSLWQSGEAFEKAGGKRERGNDRPMFEFNKIRISGKRVINDMRSNRPQGKVRAFEDGDKDTAETIEGLCRNIWNNFMEYLVTF